MDLQQYNFKVSFQTGVFASETVQAESPLEAWQEIVKISHSKHDGQVRSITLEPPSPPTPTKRAASRPAGAVPGRRPEKKTRPSSTRAGGGGAK